MNIKSVLKSIFFFCFFTSSLTYGIQWIESDLSDCSDICNNYEMSPVVSGKYYDGSNFNICRAKAEDSEGLRPGYNLSSWSPQCAIARDGVEIGIDTFDCLCRSKFNINETKTISRVAIVNSLMYQNLNISVSDLANADQPTFDKLSGTNTNSTITTGFQEGPYVDHGANLNAGDTTEIHLNVTDQKYGYNISSLYLAFGNKMTGDLRSYDVYFSRIGDDSYTLVASVTDVGQATNSWTSANWGDDTILSASDSNSFIAKNVDSVMIRWNIASGQSWYKVWEVDVAGSPSSELY